jgi:hypothetical protein
VQSSKHVEFKKTYLHSHIQFFTHKDGREKLRKSDFYVKIKDSLPPQLTRACLTGFISGSAFSPSAPAQEHCRSRPFVGDVNRAPGGRTRDAHAPSLRQLRPLARSWEPEPLRSPGLLRFPQRGIGTPRR